MDKQLKAIMFDYRAKIVYLTLFWLIITNLLFAESNTNIIKIIENLQKQSEKVISIQADIYQKVSLPNSVMSYQGKYYATAPGYFKIVHYSPYNETIVSDGKKIYWYITEEKKVWIMNVNPETNINYTPSKNLTPFVFEDFAKYLEKNYTLKYLGEKRVTLFNKFDLIEINPVDPNSLIDKILIYVDTEKSIITKREMIDYSGGIIAEERFEKIKKIQNEFWMPHKISVKYKISSKQFGKSETDYKNVIINKSIDKKLFNFIIPKNVQVVDNWKGY